jgi:hypothetical protein
LRALHGWHAGLCVAQNRRVGILGFVVGERSLFSQMAIVTLTTVPLWKVIAGPAPANYNRARKGPVFFFAPRAVSHRPEAETALVCIFALSHFRTENRTPLLLKML